MNKKLLSLAVAAAITAPAAALADATLYGKGHVSIDWFEIKNATGGDEYKGWTLNRGKIGRGNGRANRLGVKGSEDLGGSLKAIYQVEFDIPLANERDYAIANGEQSGLKMRNTYVGLKGDFGTFLVGRHDTPLKISTQKLEMFNDTMADYEGTIGFDDIRADNIIAYVSPDWGGFQFFGAAIPGSASTVEGDRNRKVDNLAEAYSVAAMYGNGPWYASAAYEVLTDELAAVSTANADTSDYKKWRVGLGIRDLSGFYLSAIYEKQQSIDSVEKIGDDDNDADLWQGQIGYAFGNNMVKGMYGKRSADVDSASDTKSWAVGFDHNFSKRTKAYLLYTRVDADAKGTDEGDWKGFSLGMIHDF